jgi:hypothetical protein
MWRKKNLYFIVNGGNRKEDGVPPKRGITTTESNKHLHEL